MQWRNSKDSLPTVLIHWLVVFVVIGLFALGLWITELSYYDRWYRDTSFTHKSVGLLLFILIVIRLMWMIFNSKPHTIGKNWKHITAKIVHGLLYALLFAMMISGYLISTADEREISVFGWFDVSAYLFKKCG
ncbi:cytochrome b/b6 domain-containing protein [Candidatus Parabeggiatoa sp. HSG14]|uniref:cytochrome b n=1 Tax=Candidatus Parabeggiatoa sp. HSG14 TaxID=3055593 RepID=UPI0025A6C1AA|nr:cytochrome b/b6 domain-containing protein [Thiotrichales bacterium HSG14]